MLRTTGVYASPWLLCATLTLVCCGGDSNEAELIQPSGLSYLGAFRLPGGDDRPQTFAYGGNAMSFRPDGDPGGGDDGFPGSLFVSGHDRLPYGELPDGDQIAEISIPAPSTARAVDGLPTAAFLQGFHEVTGGLFAGLDEIPRVGLLYLSGPGGARLHLAWGQHLQEQVASHACVLPTLASPSARGPWFIGNQSAYSANGYLFEIPSAWAAAHAAGRTIGTGRYRDGGWSGMGPALFAYVPWTDASGTLAAPRTHLAETTLLLYESSLASDDVVSRSLRGYQHADEWEGGAWLTTASGKSAVVFAGTKGTGAKYWYGWAHPAGPGVPCVETDFVGQYAVCRLATGEACPAEDLGGCSGHGDFRGWWSATFQAQILFYDPANLAQVAAGAAAYEPQPYATLSLDPYLFLNPPEWELEMLGRGVQRRFRIGDVAFDRTSGILYVLELYADGARPVVHAFRVS
jgi:hypothetical protein